MAAREAPRVNKSAESAKPDRPTHKTNSCTQQSSLKRNSSAGFVHEQGLGAWRRAASRGLLRAQQDGTERHGHQVRANTNFWGRIKSKLLLPCHLTHGVHGSSGSVLVLLSAISCKFNSDKLHCSSSLAKLELQGMVPSEQEQLGQNPAL